MPVIANSLGAFHQHHTHLTQAFTELEIFPAIQAEAEIKESRLLEHAAVDRHVPRGEISPGKVAQLVAFCRWIVEIGSVDHGSVGEAQAITPLVPAAL